MLAEGSPLACSARAHRLSLRQRRGDSSKTSPRLSVSATRTLQTPAWLFGQGSASHRAAAAVPMLRRDGVATFVASLDWAPRRRQAAAAVWAGVSSLSARSQTGRLLDAGEAASRSSCGAGAHASFVCTAPAPTEQVQTHLLVPASSATTLDVYKNTDQLFCPAQCCLDHVACAVRSTSAV